MSDTNSTDSEDKSLHEQLSEHLENCSQCQTAVQSMKPIGLGQHSPLCSEYQFIIAIWADKEGSVNNIVAHDEFGNEASKTVHERYPEQWR